MKTPSLILNTKTAKQNIKNMILHCQQHQMELRPHFKTHQSAEIAQWFKEEGIKNCTVSSLEMAAYFADADWKDICVAIPINICQLEEIKALAKKIRLSLCVDHIEAVKALAEVEENIDIFIEIDAAYGRSGVAIENTQLVDELLEELFKQTNLNFKGFLSHSGNSYHSFSVENGREIFEDSRQKLVQLTNNYSQLYPQTILSMGDTPSSQFGHSFEGVNEWRPGNFIFYDFMQYALGSCQENQIALSIHCPIIGLYPLRNEVVIYGGGVHLSKDSISYHGETIYGWAKLKGDAISKGFPVVSLSQEHGIIRVNDEFLKQLKLGDSLEIIPIHSCMTADLNSTYLTEENKQISKFRTFA